ncbi:MAG: hypothetical protein WCA20_04280 [Candidatus Sulfotelmatobacter sp.]
MAKQPGLHDRHRDRSGQTREKNGNTSIDTLRDIYGPPDFAPGLRGDAHLRTLLDRTGSDSLSHYLKTAIDNDRLTKVARRRRRLK